MKKPKRTLATLQAEIDDLREANINLGRLIRDLAAVKARAVTETLAWMTKRQEQQGYAIGELRNDFKELAARVNQLAVYTPPPPSSYRYRAYPKWVDGMVVNSRREEWRHRLYKLLGLANRN